MMSTEDAVDAWHGRLRHDPFVTRPGRCLAEIECGILSVADANAWLAAHGSTKRVASGVALSDLYAILRGDEPRAVSRRPVGFAA